MTIYAEPDEQFRPGARRITLAITAIFAVLSGAAIAALFLGVLTAILARFSGWGEEWFFYAPLFDQQLTALYSSPPLAPFYRLAGLIVPAISVTAALIVTYFWPFDESLYAKLFTQGMTLNLIALGCVAPAFDRASLAAVEAETGLPLIATHILLAVSGLWAAMLVERKFLESLRSLWWLDTVVRRLKRWMVRIPVPLAALAAAAWWSDNRSVAYGYLIVLGGTLLENLSRTPANRFDEIRDPKMTKAMFAAPLVAILALAPVLWLFGMSRIPELPPRVATFSSLTNVRLEPLSTARSLMTDRIRIREEEERKRIEAEKPKIDIHWSRPPVKRRGTK